jgi:hypothetical protein
METENTMHATIEILPSQNEDWGFWGTTLSNLEGEGSNLILSDDDDITPQGARRVLWEKVSGLLIEHGMTPEQARVYMDDCQGRHLANNICSQAFCHHSDEASGDMYDLGLIRGLPKWASEDARMMARGLHRVRSRWGRTRWVTLPQD